MEADAPRISETFNRQFGDFALLSSDQVTFYMPRPILQYASKTFASMFEVGSASNNEETPVLMQANADILDIILTFIHPGLPNPVVKDAATLGSLFRVSKLYEMDGIWSALQLCFSNSVGGYTKPLFKIEPLTSLAVALAFECKEVEKLALIEVIKGEVLETLESSGDFDIPLKVQQRIQELKENRIDWYLERLVDLRDVTFTKLEAKPESKLESKRNNQSGFLFEPVRDELRPVLKSETEKPSTAWFRTAKKAIIKQPSIAKFKVVVSEAVEKRLVSLESAWRVIKECEDEAISFESALHL